LRLLRGDNDLNFKSRLQRLERRIKQQEASPRNLATIAVVDEHGNLIKALVGSEWVTGERAAQVVLGQGRRPMKIYIGFDPETL
jgi:hypothetical protein